MVAPHLLSLHGKAVLRAQMHARRATCDPGLGAAMACHALDAAPPPPGAVVAGYWPMRGEIDPRPLLLELHRRGHPIALPVTPPPGKPLIFKQWNPAAPLRVGRFGTREPEGAELVPGWLLVPLLAFDRRGHRLGYGGGYYDRTLACLSGAFALGCAYACQEVDAVPDGEYDAPLSAVVTEDGLIFCAGA